MLSKQFSKAEWRLLSRLHSPKKIQDFLNALPQSLSKPGTECRSPRMVLREGSAYCMEGAMLAATALRAHGHRPLVLDLTARYDDDDHVVALFRQHGCWGAVSKTNHAVLRYREPVYRSIRELVMSYFHEYFLQHGGAKTLRSYAVADLSRFDKRGWMTSEEDVWYIPEHLAEIAHRQILTRAQIASLRRADPIEVRAGKMLEWKIR